MWAQLLKARVRPENVAKVRAVQQELESAITGDSPVIQAYAFQSQQDPEEYYNLIVFETEEKAREGERNPELQERIKRMQSLMDGPPEYVNLKVVNVFNNPAAYARSASSG
jgi:hypothetical protein